MPLLAQRFRDNSTLRRCVEDGYRIHSSEPDREAVKRVQFALYDLGYPDIGEIDGVWGQLTGDAVVAFKTDEDLYPTDGVASRGTIGRLDEYFAAEEPFPDEPDATARGLTELAGETVVLASEFAALTVKTLDAMAWGEPAPSPEEEELRTAVRRYVGVDAGFPGGETESRRDRLLSVLRRVPDWLGELSVEARDRAGWDEFGWSFYWAYRIDNVEHRLVVTPPFRNALTEADRVGILLRLATRWTDPSFATYGYPGTARFDRMTPHERADNPVGVAALALLVGTGIEPALKPPPTWGDLSSYPRPATPMRAPR